MAFGDAAYMKELEAWRRRRNGTPANFDGLRKANAKSNTDWFGTQPIQQGIGYNNAMVNAGMNMLGGGTNLYGGSGAAVVPGGPIVTGGGGSQMMDFSSFVRAKQQADQRSGAGVSGDMKTYKPLYQQYLAEMQEALLTPAQRLARDVKQKMDAANAANESRYQEIKGEYGERAKRMQGYAATQGKQGKIDINQNFKNLGASQQQQLAARGLLSSTISPTMQNALAPKKQYALTNLSESVARGQMAAESGEADRLAFMERKNETAPSYGEYTNLMMQLGQTGGGWNTPGYGQQQIGVGTMLGGVPMQYSGNRAASSYGAGNVRGLNATSGTTRWG